MTPSIYGILPVLLICGLASTATAAGLSTPTILADTNRDGVVNQLDAKNKDAWTDRRGAIFLPNIGDSTDRCASADLTGLPLSNDELWRCHDASGDNLLPESVQYTAPLWTLPMSGLSDDAVGHIYVESIRARDRVRIFWKAPNAFDETIWAIVDRQVSFNATSLRKGITLALDGRGLVTDAAVWDGSVRVVFEVTDRNRTTRDSVALRQAPVLLHHHLQPAEVVLSTAPGDTDTRQAESAWQAHFVRGVTDAIAGDVPIVLFNQSTDMDIWAQDFLEPGYASMPGPNGRPVTIRILLRSAQSTRSAGRQVFSQLQGPGIGGFQPGPGSGFGFEEINSGGNLETIPPYTSRSGRHWPHGRIITGTHYGTPPAESMLTFLASQRSQTPPLFLETGWLAIGHVDEVVQLLPSNSTPCGFTLAIVDTRSAISLLQNLTSSGHGTTPFLTFPKSLAVPDYTTFSSTPPSSTPPPPPSSPRPNSTQPNPTPNKTSTPLYPSSYASYRCANQTSCEYPPCSETSPTPGSSHPTATHPACGLHGRGRDSLRG